MQQIYKLNLLCANCLLLIIKSCQNICAVE
nr:MAG TPA: hypothetical protein [Caudoviricetes sp.]